ncbi:MAG: exodeoxyribonuclease V subunit alpha [Deltaproteobacteria bacterium]|nr:exodeoxyribonuclease V subunit alpha [Deltaproteobacteria bacterium]
MEDIDRLVDSGILSFLDIHFARFMIELDGSDSPEVFLAAALTSSYTRQGSVCLDLCEKGGDTLRGGKDKEKLLVCPELKDWIGSLEKSSVVGKPGEFKPLVLDDGSRLYLYRYWEYQEKLADFITERVREDDEDTDLVLLKKGLGRLFSVSSGNDVDWQKVAAFTSIVKRFCVVSGGPGTGKTATVAKILALALEQAGPKKLKIALTAPTGKAAARLQESIRLAKSQLDCPDIIKNAIPEEASTIHRLLGAVSGSPYFRHNAETPLFVDLVVVDEASMVDLALMSKLVQALPPQARLILLGDKNQLASVEAGAVLGDICDAGKAHGFSPCFSRTLKSVTGYVLGQQTHEKDAPGIYDGIVQLQKSYRFVEKSGIRALSRAVNAGDGDGALDLIKSGKYRDIQWKDLPPRHGLAQGAKNAVIHGFGEYLRAIDNPLEIFRLFDGFRILCALREGPYGSVALNLLVERILKHEKLINPRKKWYPGRPLLVTRNDYKLRLFNGDVGVVLPDRDSAPGNDLRVFFPSSEGMVRKFHPLRLSEYETVYAVTVHKSQGSEFEKVLLLLPDTDSPVLLLLPDTDSPVMTRELIYTAITRAKESVEIWGDENVFRTAVSRRIERTSGLRDALWG